MNEITFPNLNLKFNIDPIAFSLGNIHIYWYAIIIVFGIFAGFLYASWFCKKENNDTEVLYDVLLWGLPSAIIGARAYYVIFNFQLYKNNISDIFKIHEGGLAIYGGVICAFLSTFIYCKRKKINVWQIFDYGSAGFLVGQCIGRWGNFVNQEAFGTNSNGLFSMKGNVITQSLEALKESGVDINSQMGVHPTFLYESFWSFLGIILIWFVFKHKKNHGEAFSFYLVWYGVGRFFIEGLRTDSLMIFNMFRISQIVAVLCVIFGITVFVKKRNIKFIIKAE